MTRPFALTSTGLLTGQTRGARGQPVPDDGTPHPAPSAATTTATDLHSQRVPRRLLMPEHREADGFCRITATNCDAHRYRIHSSAVTH